MNLKDARWRSYWGKAAPDEPQGWHPLVFHSLDVAAVVDRLLLDRPRLRAHLADLLGLSETQLSALIRVLGCWHDLGKFAENFQYKRSDLWQELQQTAPQEVWYSDQHHDRISAALWASEDWKKRALFPAESITCLAIAAFGHHGKPPDKLPLARLPMSKASIDAAADFANWAWQRFIDADWPSDWNPPLEQLALASWWTAGLVVLADWIGSNTRWFAYATPEQRLFDLDRYFAEVAIPRAQRALKDARLKLPKSAQAMPFAALFPGLSKFEPRPAQALAERLPLVNGPQLIILEDATGSGKTEASLMLAHRLLANGSADGVFFGLPTQATADQMYERIDRVGARLYAAGETPSIVLAHVARDNHEGFRQHLAQASDDQLPNELESASLGLSEWLGQSVKRALLADLGIGTLDQSLMAALRVKHQALRLHGLFGKVLIVDEVHAYDEYMTTVLENLLKAHAIAGGSAILLSATLPARALGNLVAAFRQGAESQTRESRPRSIGHRSASLQTSPRPLCRDYPLLSFWHPGLIAPESLAIGDQSARAARRVRIEYLCERDAVHARIRAAVAAGQCVCWIRNTVHDAMEAYESLRPELSHECLQLFHARYALIDRLAIQSQVLHSFNKDSTAAQRNGRVLIATQVVEQSLDLDFDLLISDLAPIELLLQRQGRLRRHPRDIAGKVIHGEDQRGDIVFVVYGPDRHAEPDANWYSRFSRQAARVYRQHGALWQAAQVLGEELLLPQDFRRAVDAVYELSVPIPACFAQADAKAIAEDEVAPNAQAQASVCRWRSGYRRQGLDWADEERITTRLGDSIEAVLARTENDRLRPYACDEGRSEQDLWALSAIRLPATWGITLDSRHPDLRVQERIDGLRRDRRALRYKVVLVVTQGVTALMDQQQKILQCQYDKRFGLRKAGRTEPRECGERMPTAVPPANECG